MYLRNKAIKFSFTVHIHTHTYIMLDVEIHVYMYIWYVWDLKMSKIHTCCFICILCTHSSVIINVWTIYGEICIHICSFCVCTCVYMPMHVFMHSLCMFLHSLVFANLVYAKNVENDDFSKLVHVYVWYKLCLDIFLTHT